MSPADAQGHGAPAAEADASRGSRARSGPAKRLLERVSGGSPAIWAAGFAAAALVLLGEFLTLYSVEVMNATCEDLADPALADTCVRSGGEQHGFGLALVAILIALMTWGAVRGGSRPAAVALLALGLAVLVIAIVLDLPDARSAGAVGARFEEARAHAGPAILVQVVGGALAAVAAALALRAPRRGSSA